MSDVCESVAENSFDLKTISEWASGLGVAADVLMIAGQLFGKWWFKSVDTPVYGRDVSRHPGVRP